MLPLEPVTFAPAAAAFARPAAASAVTSPLKSERNSTSVTAWPPTTAVACAETLDESAPVRAFEPSAHPICRIGIERDHHAARIALQNRDHYLWPNAQGAADERVLGKTVRRGQIQINVCPEAPLIHLDASLFAKFFRRLHSKDRYRTAIGHGTLRLHQCELMLLIDVCSEHLDQSAIINRKLLSIGSLNIDY